jgi:predicted small metal-binding protein
MPRKMIDCRRAPDGKGCTLTIAGEENEVLRAAMDHAVAVHGHERTPDLEAHIRSLMYDEGASPPSRPATSSPEHARTHH